MHIVGQQFYYWGIFENKSQNLSRMNARIFTITVIPILAPIAFIMSLFFFELSSFAFKSPFVKLNSAAVRSLFINLAVPFAQSCPA
jgi:hypothetical protein